jgi:hypothetical protein
MTTIVLGIADAPGELRAFPKREREAMIMAARKTIIVDAPRWIQWSIRGGGAGETPRATASPSEAKKAKGRRTPQKWGRLKKLVKSLVGGRRRRVPKVKGSKPPKAPGACTPRPAPSYRTPIDTGNYAGSWVAEATPEGAVIYSAANPPIKAGVIELGRRPGKGIPIDPLAEWVRRKLGCQDPDQARAIAAAISFHARKHGRAGLRVLRRAHPKIAEAMVRNVERQLQISTAKAAELYRARARLEAR